MYQIEYDRQTVVNRLAVAFVAIFGLLSQVILITMSLAYYK